MSLLDIEEASGKTRLSVSTLYKRVSARQIPFLKIGGRVFFDESDLEAWLAAQRVAPVSEVGRVR